MHLASRASILLAGVPLAVGIAHAQASVGKAQIEHTTTVAHVRSAARGEAARARQLLFQVLNRASNNNVKAVVSQLMPDGSGVMQQFTVVISKSGKIRQSIYAPFTMQGVEAVDDLVHSYTYIPNERRLIVQDSPRRVECDAAFRMELAQQNYTITLYSREANVAGRTATVVLAVPQHSGLETRRFYIDGQTGYLLKLETSAGGETTVRMETKTISYPSNLSESTFVLNAPTDIKPFVMVRPKQFDTSDSSAKIGFVPVLARKGSHLPLGFVVQDVQVTESETYKTVALRITDGLVKGTVYQMPASTGSRSLRMPGTAIEDNGSVRFVVWADVPDAVREELLRYFVARSRSSIEPMAWGRMAGRLELEGVSGALFEDRGPPARGSFELRVASPAQQLRPTRNLPSRLVTVQLGHPVCQ